MAIRFKLNHLEAKTLLSYLGRVFTYNNSYWSGFYSNLRKDQRRWGMVAKVLGKKGSTIKAWAMIYKASVQAVLLFGSLIWVVADVIMTVLWVF